VTGDALLGQRGQGFVQAMQVWRRPHRHGGHAVGIGQPRWTRRPVHEAAPRVRKTLAEFNGLQGCWPTSPPRSRSRVCFTLRRPGSGRRPPAMHAAAKAKLFASSAMKAAPRPSGFTAERLYHRVPRERNLPRRQADRDRRGHVGASGWSSPGNIAAHVSDLIVVEHVGKRYQTSSAPSRRCTTCPSRRCRRVLHAHRPVRLRKSTLLACWAAW